MNIASNDNLNIRPEEANFNFDLDYLFDFYDRFYNDFKNNQQVQLIDNEKFKDYNKYLYDLNKSKSDMSEDNLKIREIKSLSEKILALIGNKKELEYVSDFFIGSESTLNNTEEGEVEKTEEDNGEEEGNDHLDYNILDNIPLNFNISEKKHFYELFPIVSKEFLKNSMMMSEEEIKKLKGDDIKEGGAETEGKSKKEVDIVDFSNPNNTLTSSSKTNFFDSLKINPIKDSDKNKNLSVQVKSTGISNIEKEMDEEVINEIFSYTKNMKNYAQSFNKNLVQGNKQLDKIEKNQEVGKNKTDRSMKGLNEFNYNIRIGFWKLLFMLLIVGVSFVMTLLSIRIFPKLVK